MISCRVDIHFVLLGIFTNGITAGERKYNILDSKSCREEPHRTWVGLFEEDYFGSGPAREICGKFEIHCTRGDTHLDEKGN